MKIETRVETLRRVEVEEVDIDELAYVQDGLAKPMPGAPRLGGSFLNYQVSREDWETYKKLGDAAWETWDKTFGGKRPETMGVWRGDSGHVCGLQGYDPVQDPPCDGCITRHLPNAFVWFPGPKDFLGSAQKALDALKAEKPEWKLELREYTRSNMCATCKECGGHLCNKPDHERCGKPDHVVSK